ncbi:MAG: DUF3185 domain-containing protein [Gammaproteobacteria bacterium]
MRSILTIIGTLLIILGIVGFSYKYLTYTSNEKLAQVGNVQITADTEKTVFVSPLFSVLSFAAGLVLVVVGISKK